MHGQVWQRIGHGGASALAPANTLAGFDAAVAVGVDMVEFDVRAYRGELILAHTVMDARQRRCVSLAAALAHLSAPRFADIGVNLDVKHVGCEAALLDALDHTGLGERALVSSQVTQVLDRVRQREPRVLTGISIGGRVARLSQRWRSWRREVLDGLAARRWDALMAQHRLIDIGLLEAVVAREGHLYAWTVNDRPGIDALLGLGVHGVTTADPRLFGAAHPRA